MSVIHVMTIPGTGREQYIEALAAQAAVCIHEDPEKMGILGNHLRSLECALEDGGDWPIFASDDVEALPGWSEELRQVQHFAPQPFVSLTHFSKYGQALVRRGIPWGIGDHGIWGPAFMVHTSVLQAYRDLVQDVADMAYEKYRNWDDGLPTVFNLIYGTKSAMCARALFQHLDLESVMGHNLGRWRHAESTIEQPGPWWGNGRSGAIGLSVQQLHRDLVREVVSYRKAGPS